MDAQIEEEYDVKRTSPSKAAADPILGEPSENQLPRHGG